MPSERLYLLGGGWKGSGNCVANTHLLLRCKTIAAHWTAIGVHRLRLG